jgi:PAS domain S-box-containing protein
MSFKNIKITFPLKIALIYFLISSFYIIYSDKLLEISFSHEMLVKLQSEKGLAFVFLTSILIFFLIKQNLKKINESEQKYRLLADNTKDLICLHKPDAEYIYLSPSIKTLLEYDKDELIGRNPYEIIHPDDIKRIEKDSHQHLLKGETADIISYRIKKKSGKYVWFESLNQPIVENNKVVGIVSSSRDITERIIANESLKNYQKSLQNLTTEILLVEEKQKKEIASNIHDHLSQSLVISKMKLEDLKSKTDLHAYSNEIDFITQHINDAIQNSRKITNDLSPPVLYQLGIVDTMYWLSDKIEEDYNIKVQFTTNVKHIKLKDNKLIFIFRSIQEIITNTIKHAKASLITIEFKHSTTGLKISILDNGIGFDVKILQKNKILQSDSGFGLFSVKERIQNINGSIDIISIPNDGTKINIFIPLKSTEEK